MLGFAGIETEVEMAATLRDVATAAGVSISTASRAFGRPDKVDAATRERIRAIAEELHYTPNRAAQALVTGRTGIVGLVVPDLNNPFFTGVVKGAQGAVRAAGTSLLISDTDEDPGVEYALVQQLFRRTDAVVLCSSRMSADDLDRAARLGPVVLVNRRHDDVPAVTFDAGRGIREVAAHLAALGHRRVGYLAGPAHSFSNADREDRIGAEFGTHGLELVHLGHHEPSLEGGRGAADRVLVAEVTAVLAYNDVLALGLLGRLQTYGVQVPRDLSIVGWDDIEFAEMVTPALTTVRTPRQEAGTAAVDYLLATLADLPARPPELPTQFVFRGTTDRPASR